MGKILCVVKSEDNRTMFPDSVNDIVQPREVEKICENWESADPKYLTAFLRCFLDLLLENISKFS